MKSRQLQGEVTQMTGGKGLPYKGTGQRFCAWKGGRKVRAGCRAALSCFGAKIVPFPAATCPSGGPDRQGNHDQLSAIPSRKPNPLRLIIISRAISRRQEQAGEGDRGGMARGAPSLPPLRAESRSGGERGCPALIRAAFQPGRRKRFFADRQVASLINIPAAGGCRGVLAGALLSRPLREEARTAPARIGRARLRGEAGLCTGSLPSPSEARVPVIAHLLLSLRISITGVSGGLGRDERFCFCS